MGVKPLILRLRSGRADLPLSKAESWREGQTFPHLAQLTAINVNATFGPLSLCWDYYNLEGDYDYDQHRQT